jgi:SAM-dependent methyltransferase
MDDAAEKTAFDKVLDIDEPGTPLESAGDWSSLVKNLGFRDKEELSLYIQDKTVLDVGSGMGGLFKEARMRGNTAKIININPRFSLKGHAKQAHEVYEMMAGDVPDNIKEINKEHDNFAIAAFSNRLPIEGSSVDVVIDNKGAVYHCLFEDSIDDLGIFQTKFNPNEQMLSETLDEYMRVLSTGGKARIGGLLGGIEGGVNLLKSVLESRGVEYTERVVNTEGVDVVSIELVKN